MWFNLMPAAFSKASATRCTPPPAPEFATGFLHLVGRSGRDSNRVEVPFDQVAPTDPMLRETAHSLVPSYVTFITGLSLEGGRVTGVVVLTPLTGGLPHTDTYLDMLRYNVLQLANALDPASGR